MKIVRHGDWETMEGVRGSDGAICNQYFYKKSRAIRHELSGKIVQQLAGYTLVEKDLRNIKTWLKQIEEVLRKLPDDLKPSNGPNVVRSGDEGLNQMAKALFVAILALYGKLFPPAKGRLVALDPGIIKISKNRETHEMLMSFRHNFAAHSGTEKIEMCKVVAVLGIDSSGDVATRLVTEMSQPSTMGLLDYQAIEKLIDELQNYCLEKLKYLRERVRNESMSDSELMSILTLYEKAGRVRRLLASS